MVATDTVVGIVGAVVLVAVMAGVFVYEYNNVPEDTQSLDGEQSHFEADYPGLSASDDLDGDGTLNYLDDDLDGDGTSNAEDDMLAVSVDVAGNLGQNTGMQAPFQKSFVIANGSEQIGGMLSYTRTGSAALGLPTFAARIVDASGQSVATATSTTSGNTVTLTFDIDEPMEAGTYNVEVSQPQPGPGGAFAGMLEVHYSTPEGSHSH